MWRTSTIAEGSGRSELRDPWKSVCEHTPKREFSTTGRVRTASVSFFRREAKENFFRREAKEKKYYF